MRTFTALGVVLAVSALAIVALPGAGLGQDKETKTDAAALYKARCQMCHMADGNNTVVKNASFADGVWVHGSSVAEISAVIRTGVKGTAMLPFKESKLSDAEVAALARYVRTFDKKLKVDQD